jgi:hypothetical protein
MAAIDLTTTGLTLPAYKGKTGAADTCTEIRAPAGHEIRIVATGAIFLFNEVADGAAAPAATARIALTADVAAAGYATRVGGPNQGTTYGTVCVAAQSGTVDLGVELLPQERGT